MRKKIKNITVVLFILLLFFQANYLLISYGIFKINQKNLIEEFCEKKKDDCDACCYFNKKMNESEKKADPVEKNVERRTLNITGFVIDGFDDIEKLNTGNLNYSNHKISPLTGFIRIPDNPPKV